MGTFSVCIERCAYPSSHRQDLDGQSRDVDSTSLVIEAITSSSSTEHNYTRLSVSTSRCLGLMICLKDITTFF